MSHIRKKLQALDDRAREIAAETGESFEVVSRQLRSELAKMILVRRVLSKEESSQLDSRKVLS